MELKISNIGKIRSAKVRFDGLTVICGNNNTGKSTVGKILFALFNSMCDFESKISEEKSKQIDDVITRHLPSGTRGSFQTIKRIRLEIDNLLKTLNDDMPFNTAEIRNNLKTIFEQHDLLQNADACVEEILGLLTSEKGSLFAEYVIRYLKDIFNGQIKTLNSRRVSKIDVCFHDGKNVITLRQRNCTIEYDVPILHHAYYIHNPFVLDQLNNIFSMLTETLSNDLDTNVIQAIRSARAERAANKMSGIFESVANKEKLSLIYTVLAKAYSGETVVEDGQYFYRENGRSIDIRNISTGLKSFTLIEQLLESGKLKQKDVLILDEPEIHLHPEWQTIYAEMIVLLQKTFDLTILVATHSFHFLEALQFFMKKHGIDERGNYYMV